MPTSIRHAFAATLTLLVVACAPESPVPASLAPAGRGPAPTTVAPAATDEASLRAAVASALVEQRFHSPAGNNALEGYLALRALRQDDADVATAMMEMLPYAVIAAEQAIARADFAEARRLADLIARADPQAPALSRLRDTIAVREAEDARRVSAEADAARLHTLEAERLAAQASTPPGSATETPVTGSATDPAPAVPPPAAGISPASPPAASPAIASPPAAAAPPPAVRPAPTLLSSPPPRYPVMALRRRLEGDVTVAFTVRADGSVGDARVLSASTPEVFDEAALAAVARWRFAPGVAPQDVRRVLQFRLPGAEG